MVIGLNFDSDRAQSLKLYPAVKQESILDTVDDVDWWPMFHHDLNNTGNSSSPTAPEDPVVKWTFQTDFVTHSSPAIVNDKVYIGSDDEQFYCLDANTGDKIWNYPIPGGTSSCSACVVDGKVYVGTTYYNIFCWDADTGDLIWNFSKPYGSCSSPAVVNGKVYITKRWTGNENGTFYCLDAETGEELWNVDTGDVDLSSPAVCDGKVYLGGDEDMNLYCYNAENGTELWKVNMNGKVYASPSVANGKVYCGGGWDFVQDNDSTANGRFYCLDADNGEEIWSRNISNTMSSPAIGRGAFHPDKVYFVAIGGNITCLNTETGETVWEYPTGSNFGGSAPAVADEKIYVHIPSVGNLLCLDADWGGLKWSLPVSGIMTSPSPSVANGTVYIAGGGTCKVWAFWDKPSDPPLVPTIDGPTSGTVQIDYNYTFITTDPDGDNVSYKVDWGDDSSSGWVGPYPSGESITLSHNWSISGNYSITAKAMDLYYVQSNWSDPFVVSIIPSGLPPMPTNPNPTNGSLDISVHVNPWWECEENNTYNVYFEANDSTPDVLIFENQTNKWYEPGKLNYTTIYYWKIVAWNIWGNTSGPVWHFTTEENIPPYQPRNPTPPNGSIDVDINVNLSWDGGDPRGDDVTYDIYFEVNDSTPDVLVSENHNETSFDPGTLEYNSTYYWQIIARDYLGLETDGPVWNFTTTSDPNNPPFQPSNPSPENGSVNIEIDTTLSWTGGDPNENDTVVYDIFFEENDSTPDIQVANDTFPTWFYPGPLKYNTTYYWQIIAIDNHFAVTNGPVWHFTTEKAPEPDLSCDGSLSWTDVKTGETVEGSFTVENIGESGTLLDWEVVDWPSDWGIWTFTPISGNDLTPEDGEFMVNVSVVAPDEKNSEFTGEVKIVNKENNNDFCIVDVSLSTPKNKSFNFNFDLLSWLLERFPILQWLLNILGVYQC